jgi:hypothetical protein
VGKCGDDIEQWVEEVADRCHDKSDVTITDRATEFTKTAACHPDTEQRVVRDLNPYLIMSKLA